jgi:hypothetical protein
MKPLFSISASCHRQQGKGRSNNDGNIAIGSAGWLLHSFVIWGYDNANFYSGSSGSFGSDEKSSSVICLGFVLLLYYV